MLILVRYLCLNNSISRDHRKNNPTCTANSDQRSHQVMHKGYYTDIMGGYHLLKSDPAYPCTLLRGKGMWRVGKFIPLPLPSHTLRGMQTLAIH